MVNVAQAAALQALMRAHNNALKRKQRNYAAAGANLMAPCMGNVCLNYRQPTRTANQQRLRNAAMTSRQQYNQAYQRLKNALRQAVWANNNNVYSGERPPNYERLTTNARWNLGSGRAVHAATTIQKHVRGTQRRVRANTKNPRTALGAGYLWSMALQNTGKSGRRVTGAQLHAAARRIQSAFRKRRARR
jgi:hypothetical protein